MELTLQPWGFLPVYLHVVHADEAECGVTPSAGPACDSQAHDDALGVLLEQLCESRWGAGRGRPVVAIVTAPAARRLFY